MLLWMSVIPMLLRFAHKPRLSNMSTPHTSLSQGPGLKPFIDRWDVSECLDRLARTDTGQLVVIEHLQATRPWGERQFKVKNEQGSAFVMESALEPVDESSPEAVAFRARLTQYSRAMRLALMPGRR